jgi:hypothetical protein
MISILILKMIRQGHNLDLYCGTFDTIFAKVANNFSNQFRSRILPQVAALSRQMHPYTSLNNTQLLGSMYALSTVIAMALKLWSIIARSAMGSVKPRVYQRLLSLVRGVAIKISKDSLCIFVVLRDEPTYFAVL